MIYPDSDDTTTLGNGTDGVYDRVEYTYNRLSERTEVKDQNGTVHAFMYDGLGRLTQDRVTTVGTDVDGAVRRIARTYEVRGMVEHITSYDNATVGQGAVVNDVKLEYNSFGLLVKDYQQHDAAVNASTSPKVQYAYTDGSSNHARLIGVTYPNQRVLHHEYSSGADDNLSRVSYLSETNASGTRYVEYARLGLGQFVRADFHRAGANDPVLRWNLAFGAGSDPYDGLDAFGRVKDHRWTNYAGTSDKVKIGHGYDRAGNRLWRKDDVSAAQNPAVYLDELYTDDGVYQLKDRNRGQLNANKDGLVSNTKNFAEAWTLDATGNWSNFKQDATGGGWTLDQDRTHTKANEIEEIEESSAHVAHDRAGNMARVPKPSDWSSHYHLVYDAWNRLVEVLDADGETLVAEYAYDGRNFRVLKKTYDAEGELSETRHFYYSQDWQVLEERVGTDTVANVQNVWGLRYVDDLVLRDRDTSTPHDGVDQRHYALQDANWNVVAIVAPDGNVAERYTYAAYGKAEYRTATFALRTPNASTLGWTVLYTGRDLDLETGLEQFRNRYLHPDLGRFVVPDPVGYASGDANLYRYVSDNPAKYTDPIGTNIWVDTVLHQNICVDTWKWIPGGGAGARGGDCPPGAGGGQWVKGSPTCFTFHPRGLANAKWYPISMTWLGWATTKLYRTFVPWPIPILPPGPATVGWIDEVKDQGGAPTFRRHVTNVQQDQNWLKYMRGRAGTSDRYVFLIVDCVTYTDTEYFDAPKHW